MSFKQVIMSFRRCKGTMFFQPPQYHWNGISHTTCLVLQAFRFTIPSDIELRRVYQACTNGIFDHLMSRVDTQFAENILAMGSDGMDTGVALCSYLFGRFTLGYSLDDITFRMC